MTPEERQCEKMLQLEAKQKNEAMTDLNFRHVVSTPPPHQPNQAQQQEEQMCTNADTLTNTKLLELQDMVKEKQPEVIAISEVKPKITLGL